MKNKMQVNLTWSVYDEMRTVIMSYLTYMKIKEKNIIDELLPQSSCWMTDMSGPIHTYLVNNYPILSEKRFIGWEYQLDRFPIVLTCNCNLGLENSSSDRLVLHFQRLMNIFPYREW